MKKTIILFIAAILMAGSLTACGTQAAEAGQDSAASEKLQIVTTIFPEYDWVRNIVGENSDRVEVTMLLDNGVDLHSYQPTAEDILKISTCDLFIYIGGESDGWVEAALREAANEDMVAINLLEALGEKAKEEELVEGMEEDGHDHKEEHGHEEEHDHEEEEGGHEEEHDHDGAAFDEHIWLSLRNASVLCEIIEEAIASLDSANAEAYAGNLAAYQKKLEDLDEKYQKAVSESALKTLLFGDRFPFRYLVDDYGLSYYAAFVGCSAETEASFETITFLAGKTDELSLHSVITIEGTKHKIAETVVQNTASKNQQVLILDSMQSTTSKQVAGGTTYLSIMEKNLEVLKAALK